MASASWLLPAIVLGLFTGRVLSEWLRLPIPAAGMVTTASIVAAALVYRGRRYTGTWPILLLLGYVLYPYPDPSAALICVSLVLVTLIWQTRLRYLPWDWERYHSARCLLPLLLAAGSFSLYLATLSPDILPADSGEFQLIATKLGLAHPPGFPLYTVLAYLVTKLPFGETAAWKVSLFSAITSMLTLLVVYYSILRLTKNQAGAVISSLTLGLSTTFWSQATTANIRSLTTLFAALMYLLFIVITRPGADNATIQPGNRNPGNGRKAASHPNREHSKRQSPLLLPLFVLVLVAGVSHHASLIFIGAILFGLLLLAQRQRLRQPRIWTTMLVALLIALIPLVYIPLRDSAGAIGAPGNINTLSGFLDHILARGFSGDFFYFTEPHELWARLKVMINVLTFQFPPLMLILMAAGLVLLALRDKSMAFALGGTFIVHTLISAVYRAPQTVEYMLPATVPAVLFLGFLIGRIDNFRRHRLAAGDLPSWRSISAALISILVIYLVIGKFKANFASYRWLQSNRDTREYVQPLLEEAPVNAAILAGWHWVTPMRYLQNVEGLRPDLDIQYVFPTGEPYLDTWARRINEELSRGKDVVVTHYNEGAYRDLPDPEPFGEGYIFRQTALATLPPGFEVVDIQLDGQLQLLGKRQAEKWSEVGQEFVIDVGWQALTELEGGSSLFMHLIGSDGRIFAQDDLLVPEAAGKITTSQFRLTSRLGSAAGDYSLLIGLDTPGQVENSEPANRIKIGQLNITPMAFPPTTENPVYLPLADTENQAVLIGYDWDTTITGQTRLYLHWQNEQGYYSEIKDINSERFELPNVVGPWGVTRKEATIAIDGSSTYIPLGQSMTLIANSLEGNEVLQPGRELPLTVSFSAYRPVLRDQVISLRLVGYEEDGFHWTWWDLDDGVPAMGAIPTLKWIAGSLVSDPHWLLVDPAATPGQQIEPLLRVYDAFTNQPLPILDERITDQTPWIPLRRLVAAD